MQRKSKLNPKGDGPFQILKKINDNTYKLDLPCKYSVSATFNVSDLTLFNVGKDHLRTNPFKESGNDENQVAVSPSHSMQVLKGVIIQNKAKKLREEFQGFC